jgi:hypothetical protein
MLPVPQELTLELETARLEAETQATGGESSGEGGGADLRALKDQNTKLRAALLKLQVGIRRGGGGGGGGLGGC